MSAASAVKKVSESMASVEPPTKQDEILEKFNPHNATVDHPKLNEIIDKLKSPEATVEVVLVGEAGVGKTRLAREVCERAGKDNVASRTLWLFLNKDYSETSIITEISQQLSLISKMEEMEDYSKSVKHAEVSNPEIIKEMLKKKIEDMIEKKKKIEDMMEKKSDNQCILLVLDDVRDQEHEEDVIGKIDALQQLKKEKMLKILSTRREHNSRSGIQEMKEVFKIEPLSQDEAESLLKNTVKQKVSDLQSFDDDEISKKVVANSNRIPATVSAIAEVLNFVAEVDEDLTAAFKELAGCVETYSNGRRQLMRYAYELLPKKETILVKCCWHCRMFFSKNTKLHYSELIVNWILEGCFEPVDSLEAAYKEGHRVLMKLIDLKLLKIQEDNAVAMEESALLIPDARDGKLGVALNLGLYGVYEDKEWKGFGRTAPANGMIKSISRDEENRWEKVSTLLLDGVHLGRQVYETFFNPMKDLQQLVLMNPRFESLPSSISEMKNLHLLVLRGCDRLTSINPVELPSLTVLEISGARNFSEIPESVFKFPKIQSLNFSNTGIECIPGSLLNMMKLRSLVLRGCSSLKSLPKLSKLVHLIVIDLSGATSLEKMEDKSLSSLQSLQILDLSQTKIEKMPILKGLNALTRVSLNDCEKIKRLRRLTSLPDLQVLELSGSSNLIEFHDDAFESKNSLKILDLSGANITCLPTSFKSFTDLEFLRLSGMPELIELGPDTFEHMSNLRFLDLSNTPIKELPEVSKLPNLRRFKLIDCKMIKSLPSLTSLQKLEVFDVSGCSLLEDIEEDSFQNMASLLELNLSGTKIQKLPSIVDCLPELQQFFMRNCTHLVEFPSKLSLAKLEELDLSGTKCSKEIKDHHLCVDIDMMQLQILNLSGTNFQLKSPLKLTNLKKLLLRDSVLRADLDFKNLTQLEVLDLSRTQGITTLPLSIEKLSRLRKLLLRDSSVTDLSNMESLENLEVLDLWGVKITKFPDCVATIKGLKRLDLPELSIISESIEWKKIKHIPGELNLSRCSSLDFSGSINDKPSILVNDTEFFKNYELWGNCASQFHTVVRSQMDQLDDGDVNMIRDEGRLRDIYFSSISLKNSEAPLMKVIGFDSFPSGVEDAVKQAEYVSLIQNRFLKSLSALGSLKKMKGCWLQGCSAMGSILHEKETTSEREEKRKIERELENLEILWISSLPKLRAFYDLQRPGQIFSNLKRLYLDCCPLIETVFSLGDLPSNLEILQVKFCDKLKTLFEHDDQTRDKPTLPKLSRLNLIELPQLSCIGAKFPALETAVVINCPKLDSDKEISTLKNESIPVFRVKESWDGSKRTPE